MAVDHHVSEHLQSRAPLKPEANRYSMPAHRGEPCKPRIALPLRSTLFYQVQLSIADPLARKWLKEGAFFLQRYNKN